MAFKTVTDLVNEARAKIENLNVNQVSDELAAGNCLIVDIREKDELEQQGIIPGSFHAPRGIIEFLADPSHPAHKPEFDSTQRIILHCAGGGRSAMATAMLQEMGYTNIAHLDGGMNAWKAAGKPIVSI
jgi:rhodanese-related sulfurtransferase